MTPDKDMKKNENIFISKIKMININWYGLIGLVLVVLALWYTIYVTRPSYGVKTSNIQAAIANLTQKPISPQLRRGIDAVLGASGVATVARALSPTRLATVAATATPAQAQAARQAIVAAAQSPKIEQIQQACSKLFNENGSPNFDKFILATAEKKHHGDKHEKKCHK